MSPSSEVEPEVLILSKQRSNCDGSFFRDVQISEQAPELKNYELLK